MFQQIQGMISKVPAIFTTLYGWILLAFSSLLTFISPHEQAFLVVFVCVFIDLIWGVWAAVKQGRYATSEGFRETAKKIAIYATMLIPILLIERLLVDEWFVTIRVACALAAACELWSASANMLIVKPNMTFIKLFRVYLKGEIEKKLNTKFKDLGDGQETDTTG